MSVTGRALDGVAVVSDIVGSVDPSQSARKLSTIIRAFNENLSPAHNVGLSVPGLAYSPESIKASVSDLLSEIKRLRPLVHQVTIRQH